MRLTETDRTAILADGSSVRFDLDDCVVQCADRCVDLLTVSEAQVMRALRIVAMLDGVDRDALDAVLAEIHYIESHVSTEVSEGAKALARALEEASR